MQSKPYSMRHSLYNSSLIAVLNFCTKHGVEWERVDIRHIFMWLKFSAAFMKRHTEHEYGPSVWHSFDHVMCSLASSGIWRVTSAFLCVTPGLNVCPFRVRKYPVSNLLTLESEMSVQNWILRWTWMHCWRPDFIKKMFSLLSKLSYLADPSSRALCS